MWLPTLTATCGLPVTVTASPKRTVTSIDSPCRKYSPLAGELENQTKLTTGPVAWFAPTLRRGSAATAVWLRSASVVPSVAVMVPPLRRMALAAMLMPSPSRSSACTSYSKRSTWMPRRETLLGYVANLVRLPMVSATCGLPVTLTVRSRLA